MRGESTGVAGGEVCAGVDGELRRSVDAAADEGRAVTRGHADAVVSVAVGGLLGAQALGLTLLLAPGYYLGMVAGTRLFSRFNDTRFRRFTLFFMLAVAAGILLA